MKYKFLISGLTCLLLYSFPFNTLLAQEILFKDNFNGSISSQWEFIDRGEKSSPSNWFVSGGRLIQHTNIGSINFPVADGTIAVAGDSTWRDYQVYVKAKPDDNDFFGIVFRYTDDKNYYRFGIDADKHMGSYLHCFINGKLTEISRTSHTYEPGREIGIRINADGENITIYLNDIKIIEARDGAVKKGRAGLFTWFQTEMIFDNFVIAETEEEN